MHRSPHGVLLAQWRRREKYSRRWTGSIHRAPSRPRIRALRRRMQLPALEAIEAEGIEARFASAGDVLGRQPADGQRLEPVPGIHDCVRVLQHPVAYRIVVGRVGDDAARRGELPVVRAAAEALERGREAGYEELAKSGPGPVLRGFPAVP